MNSELWTILGPILIGLGASALGGGLPAILTYRATKSRLDGEADERASHVEVNLTDATQKIVDSAAKQIASMGKVMEHRIDAVEKNAELALKEARLVKKELENAHEKVDSLTVLVCELYSGAMKLIEQLSKEGITPDYKMPELPEEVQKILEANGWH
jgi:hypothetical protein